MRYARQFAVNAVVGGVLVLLLAGVRFVFAASALSQAFRKASMFFSTFAATVTSSASLSRLACAPSACWPLAVPGSPTRPSSSFARHTHQALECEPTQQAARGRGQIAGEIC
jgi:hypothetical protein